MFESTGHTCPITNVSKPLRIVVVDNDSSIGVGNRLSHERVVLIHFELARGLVRIEDGKLKLCRRFVEAK